MNSNVYANLSKKCDYTTCIIISIIIIIIRVEGGKTTQPIQNVIMLLPKFIY